MGASVSLRIVSGGQSGADRAALDVALALGIEVGGWLPRGRAAEDGPLPERYTGMRECDSPDPAVRTRLNVRDSDATVILSHGELSGGSALTLEIARELGRPVLHLDLGRDEVEAAVETLRRWLEAVQPRTLNVAGPRASADPGIYAATRAVLMAALRVNRAG